MSEKKTAFFSEIVTCDSLFFLMDHSKFIATIQKEEYIHTGQCKRTGGCYDELVVAFFSTGGGVKGKKIYTC